MPPSVTKASKKSDGAETSRASGNNPQTTSGWEWVVAALGLALLLGVIGYMTYYALSYSARVPVITVEPIAMQPVADRYVVRFRARNHSSATAASLKIAGELRQGSSVVESSEATLDYLPPFSERQGGLFFSKDPTSYEVHLFPKSYDEP